MCRGEIGGSEGVENVAGGNSGLRNAYALPVHMTYGRRMGGSCRIYISALAGGADRQTIAMVLWYGYSV